MNEWLLIAGMALVTFIPRYLPFALAGRVEVPPRLEQALEFVPIAVLSAIIAQAALFRDGNLELTLENLHLLATVVAFTIALITRHLFATIAAGLASFVLLRLLL